MSTEDTTVSVLVGYGHSDKYVEVDFIENDERKYSLTLTIEEAEKFVKSYMLQIHLAKEMRKEKKCSQTKI